MARIDIIGAGIGGLATGIYLQQRGVEVHIYESHTRAGGLCCNWRRGDYEFNGCLHWILGARRGTSFGTMWREIVDMDSLELTDHAERVVMELPDGHGGTWSYRMPNDVEEFGNSLKALTTDSEDKKQIERWEQDIRLVQRHLEDLPPLIDEPTLWGRLKHYARLWRMAPMLTFMMRWSRHTNRTYAHTMTSERLRQVVENLYMDETGMTPIIFGQAYMASRVASYPRGGSQALTDLMVDKLQALGGQLHMGTRVARICESNGVATGIETTRGERTHSDAVCSAADWHWTVFEALGGRHATRLQRKMLTHPSEEMIYASYCRVHIGLADEQRGMPHYMRKWCDMTLPDGTHHTQMEVEMCGHDTTLAPKGKSTLTVNYTTHKGKWWMELRQNDPEAYAKAKEEVAAETMKMLHGMVDTTKVEVVDVVTPATYNRYTSNMWGSSQGWSANRNLLKRVPTGASLPGLKRFAMAGHWTVAGGGLPIALLSARQAAQLLLKQMGMKW